MTDRQQTALLRVYALGSLHQYGKVYRELAALRLVEEYRPNRWRCTAKGEAVAAKELEAANA